MNRLIQIAADIISLAGFLGKSNYELIYDVFMKCRMFFKQLVAQLFYSIC